MCGVDRIELDRQRFLPRDHHVLGRLRSNPSRRHGGHHSITSSQAHDRQVTAGQPRVRVSRDIDPPYLGAIDKIVDLVTIIMPTPIRLNDLHNFPLKYAARRLRFFFERCGIGFRCPHRRRRRRNSRWRALRALRWPLAGRRTALAPFIALHVIQPLLVH